MIYTVTLNPSIDYFVKTDGLKEGEINLVKNRKRGEIRNGVSACGG